MKVDYLGGGKYTLKNLNAGEIGTILMGLETYRDKMKNMDFKMFKKEIQLTNNILEKLGG